jgi:hypothetical protein
VPRTAPLTVATKKKSLHDSQRDTPRVKRLRRVFRQQMVPAVQAIAEHVKFIDELDSWTLSILSHNYWQ